MPAPTRSLTPAAVHDHVRRHCFTPAAGPSGRVGVELELLTATSDGTGRRPAATELFSLIDGLALPKGGRLTVEPGGQIELSSRPQLGAGAAVDATAADLGALRAGLRAAGIRTTAAGLDSRPYERVVPAPRYEAMERYFDGDGGAGLAMMCGTASVQVNVDLGEPSAVARRWRLAHAVGPVLVAAFANSPLAGGRPTGARSSRQQLWGALDPSRSAPALSVLPPADSWARYALAARVMLVRAGPDHFPAVRSDLPFARWMAEGHELGYPTLDDLDYHLTTLFPPVRPKGWLELRMIDAVPDPWWQVAVAVTAALLDDPEASARAERACRPVAGCWAQAAAHGLGHPGLATAADACFAAAIDALPRLGVGRDTVAACEDFLDRYVGRRRCPGDDVVDAWRAGVRDMAAASRR